LAFVTVSPILSILSGLVPPPHGSPPQPAHFPEFFVSTRQNRPEYLYFSPNRLSLIGIAAAVAGGAISGFVMVKAWPETGIFPQYALTAPVDTFEPERVYNLPEPPVTVKASTSWNTPETTIPAPAPIIIDQGTTGVRRTPTASRAVNNSHGRQTRVASHRRNHYFSTAYGARTPGAWW
jgi:hypothetical protein